MAFTVHEEGGCYGAKALAQRERPEVFIAVDGSPWKPRAGIEVSDQPTCWSKDFLIHYDQRLIALLAQAAQSAGTQLQTAVLTNASSDASAVYDCGAAPRVAFTGHTRANSHGFEVAQLNVFPNIVATLFELLKLKNWWGWKQKTGNRKLYVRFPVSRFYFPSSFVISIRLASRHQVAGKPASRSQPVGPI